MWKIFLFYEEEARQKGFPKKLLHYCKRMYRVFVARFKNIYSDWIVHTTVV